MVRINDSTSTTADGVALFWRDWEPVSTPVLGGIYLLHGLGEHVGRYDALARELCAAGWRVRAHDHRGHGRSGGARGVLAPAGDLRRDAAELVSRFAAECASAPLLLGHSMGGALAAELVLSGALPVRALVLSSPALALRLSAIQKALLWLLGHAAPDLAIANGLRPQWLSHDQDEVQAYVTDALVHRRVSARLLQWMVAAGKVARMHAGRLGVPTLLLYGGADRIVDPEGARQFARQAAQGMLTTREYEAAYHELFHESAPWRHEALADLLGWIVGQNVAPEATGEGKR